MSYAEVAATSTPVKSDDNSKKRELSSSSSPNQSWTNPEKKNRPSEPDVSDTPEPPLVRLADSDFARITNMVKDMISALVEPLVKSIVSEVTDKLEKRIETLEKDKADLSEKVTLLSTKVEKLELDHDAAEQYSRRNCLRITGVPESEFESTDAIVMDIATRIDADITLSDIDRSHRVGQPAFWTTPKGIIVKFATYRARANFYRKRVSLKGNNDFPNVFINESLTATRSKIFKLTRKLVKDNKINQCWTYDGQVYLKDKSDKKCAISKLSDLDQYSS